MMRSVLIYPTMRGGKSQKEGKVIADDDDGQLVVCPSRTHRSRRPALTLPTYPGPSVGSDRLSRRCNTSLLQTMSNKQTQPSGSRTGHLLMVHKF